MNDVIRYILQFLLQDLDESIINHIGYTDDRSLFAKYKLVIIPSGFFNSASFGSKESVPSLPLKEIEEVPLLFGSYKVEWIDNTWIIHADIIASTFFLISRYEEVALPKARDEHGRFLASFSLLGKANLLLRPIVDEYGVLLRRWIKQANITTVTSQKKGIRHYYLTHDIDEPYYCRTWHNVLRCLIHGESIKQIIKYKTGPFFNDPYCTFDWLQTQNHQLIESKKEGIVSSIFFLKSGGKGKLDKPIYTLQQKDIKKIIDFCSKNNIEIGLHASYHAGYHPSIIEKEKRELTQETKQPITKNRHHYLHSCEPKDMRYLIDAGITEDFTMGFADHIGFRLGTSRTVRWIDPIKLEVTPLLLHPLSIMDVSLSNPKYMGLNYERALEICNEIISKTQQHHGDLTLLWHNSSVSKLYPIDWQQKLYSQLIKNLIAL